jgi:hypothetical protein
MAVDSMCSRRMNGGRYVTELFGRKRRAVGLVDGGGSVAKNVVEQCGVELLLFDIFTACHCTLMYFTEIVVVPAELHRNHGCTQQ